jgi:L-threonylcarbamoyladenylate synthase
MMEQELQNALKVLREGGTILYPTDTIWGIGCDATHEKAVEKIFTIKQRKEKQGLIALVSDNGMLNRFVKEVPEMAWDLIELSNTDDDFEEQKPLSIIYDAGRGFAKNVPADDGSIAVRLVRDDFCQRMIHKLGRPLVSTSANISGTPAPQNFSEIADEIKNSVDYVVNWRQNENGNAKPSSIIRLKANGEFQIIRQ